MPFFAAYPWVFLPLFAICVCGYIAMALWASACFRNALLWGLFGAVCLPAAIVLAVFLGPGFANSGEQDENSGERA